MGFTKSEADPNLYLLQVGKEPLILVLYVDDLFLTRGEKLITRCKIELASDFKMKNVGLMHYLLGLEVWQQPDEIFLEHEKYAVEILRRFEMMDCKSMITPYDHQSQYVGGFIFRLGGSHNIHAVDWVVDVPGKHQTRYFLCCQHLESVHG